MSVSEISKGDLHHSLIPLDSREGRRLRSRGDVNERLIETFEPQSHPAFCVLASSAHAVRHLQHTRVSDADIMQPLLRNMPSDWFSSLGFPLLDEFPLPAALKSVLSSHIMYAGLSTASLGLLLSANDLNCISQQCKPGEQANQEAIGKFRAHVQSVSSAEADSKCLIINYLRGAVHQLPITNGHMSLVAGYHADSDHCLVLDTNTWRYPPIWISLEAIYAAMSHPTNIGVPRGYTTVFHNKGV